MSTVQPVKSAARLRLWAGVLGLCYTAAVAVGCDLAPNDWIVSEPLPRQRPVHVGVDDDAGLALPDGARACKTASDCDDGIDCSVDECLPAGFCSNRLDSTMCGDGLLCNGVETCSPTEGCIAAPPPTCDDKDPCTIDRCDEDAKACIHDIRDFDHDGEADYHCAGGTDCDDFDDKRGMLARELCGDMIDNDCDESIDEPDCGAVMHDTCEDALDVSAGGVFNISTVGAVGNYSLGCSEASGMRDVVFKFRLDSPRDAKFVASGLHQDGTEELAVISLQTSCGQRSSELQCAHGYPGDLRVRALPAGEYAVVASAAQGAGSILLKVTFSDATETPLNTTCDAATDVSAGGHFDGDFIDIGDSTDTGCGTAKLPDLYYKLTLAAESDLEVSAIGTESKTVTLALRRGCSAEAEEVRCQSDQRILAYYHQLPPGEYVLVVEGPSDREIAFGLDVAVLPPTPPPVGDSCVSPETLKFGELQTLMIGGMQDDVETRCLGQGAADVVLGFTLEEPQDLNVQVRADDMTSVTVAIQTECGNELTERVCRDGMPLSSLVHALPAGQYFLVIDNYSATQVEVQVDKAPPTPVMAVTGNDTCYSAVEVPETGGLFSGDTRGLQADYVNCAKMPQLSSDAAFRLTLTTAKRVVARVDTSSFDGMLMRFKQPEAGVMLCEGERSACNDDSENHVPQLDEMLSAGTYYFVVTGYSMSDAGTYTLDVSISDT
jgi:hypothetical protein